MNLERENVQSSTSVTAATSLCPLQRRWFFFLTEFFCGMSVMAVELGASRLLAPYFSSSQIVWTIIIGAIMIAMALGNVWGGRLADKNPDPKKLYLRLLIAGVWIAAIPFLGKYIIAVIALGTALVITHNYLIWASLFSCLILFVFPLMLLGTVTPSLIRSTVNDLGKSGSTAGALGALNTIGSIIGTFTPTFITIPTVGTAVTFLIFAGILILLSLSYLVSSKVYLIRCGVCLVLTVGCVVAGAGSRFAFWENDLLYEGESVYNYLQVKRQGQDTILSTNVLFGVQSVKTDRPGLTGMYYDTALAGMFMAGVTEKEHLDVLILGMGSGTYATQCLYYFDNVTVTGVEIDARIAALSRTYFGLPEEVTCAIDDGRSYLSAGEGKDKTYDLILVDAYQDITIPFQMTTEEFFKLVSAHLRDDGAMVVNMNMYSDAEESVNSYLSDTICSVFPTVATASAGGNRELFAMKSGDVATSLNVAIPSVEDASLQRYMQQVLARLTAYNSTGLKLTDDCAPVELLGMRVIDELISEEIRILREQMSGRSLKELFELIQ